MILAAIAFIACAPTPGPGAEGALAERLSVTGACADAFFYATNADQSLALIVQIDGLDGRHRTWALPDADLAVHLDVGGNLTYCTDVYDDENMPYVDESTPATAGTVEFFRDSDGGYFPIGTMVLEDLVFDEVVLDRLVIVSSFGWYAG